VQELYKQVVRKIKLLCDLYFSFLMFMIESYG
jgi:hypothetical protein